MAATKLITRRVHKPWGRHEVPAMFGTAEAGAGKIGEIWFEHPAGGEPELLIKYLFTSERLSIQVHPDDAFARAAGHARGKDEAWVVIAADENAEIGIGLRTPIASDQLRAAAIDGSIEDLMDWRPAEVGDVYYSPAGTIHALGPGLCIIEVQQNADLTYRLYDYGRGRELHLDEGVAVANPAPFKPVTEPYDRTDTRRVLAEGPAFILERWAGQRESTISSDSPVWLIPVHGRAAIDGQELDAGTAWTAEGSSTLKLEDGADVLVAYIGELRDEPLR